MKKRIKYIALPIIAAMMMSCFAGCGDNSGLNEDYSNLQNEYSELQNEYSELKDMYDTLYADYESGKAELEKTKTDVVTLGNVLGSLSPAELETSKSDLNGSYEFTYTPPATAAPVYSSTDSYTSPASSASSSSSSAEYSYIGNINSHKFHKPSCGTLPNPENRVYFSSRDEAVNSGYTACKRCNP